MVSTNVRIPDRFFFVENEPELDDFELLELRRRRRRRFCSVISCAASRAGEKNAWGLGCQKGLGKSSSKILASTPTGWVD